MTFPITLPDEYPDLEVLDIQTASVDILTSECFPPLVEDSAPLWVVDGACCALHWKEGGSCSTYWSDNVPFLDPLE